MREQHSRRTLPGHKGESTTVVEDRWPKALVTGDPFPIVSRLHKMCLPQRHTVRPPTSASMNLKWVCREAVADRTPSLK